MGKNVTPIDFETIRKNFQYIFHLYFLYQLKSKTFQPGFGFGQNKKVLDLYKDLHFDLSGRRRVQFGREVSTARAV